ncbi:hypothetical protein F5146DRAFT_997855 [Armillaria mellea]|nr:hypothetical protein F5146DRAFT_997855 [Armillaria mellea]
MFFFGFARIHSRGLLLTTLSLGEGSIQHLILTTYGCTDVLDVVHCSIRFRPATSITTKDASVPLSRYDEVQSFPEELVVGLQSGFSNDPSELPRNELDMGTATKRLEFLF